MDHYEAIRVENALRKLNGEHWGQSADEIERSPAKTMKRGLLEHILGDMQAAEELEMVIELALHAEDVEQDAADFIIQLATKEPK